MFTPCLKSRLALPPRAVSCPAFLCGAWDSGPQPSSAPASLEVTWCSAAPSHQALPRLSILLLFAFSRCVEGQGKGKQNSGGPVNVSPESQRHLGSTELYSWWGMGSPANFMWASEDLYTLNLGRDSETKELIKLPTDLDLEGEALSWVPRKPSSTRTRAATENSQRSLAEEGTQRNFCFSVHFKGTFKWGKEALCLLYARSQILRGSPSYFCSTQTVLWVACVLIRMSTVGCFFKLLKLKYSWFTMLC